MKEHNKKDESVFMRLSVIVWLKSGQRQENKKNWFSLYFIMNLYDDKIDREWNYTLCYTVTETKIKLILAKKTNDQSVECHGV